jgi:hypothetical protein
VRLVGFIIRIDRCFFCKERQLAGLCTGDVGEAWSEIFYVTQKYLSLRRVNTEFSYGNVFRSSLFQGLLVGNILQIQVLENRLILTSK